MADRRLVAASAGAVVVGLFAGCGGSGRTDVASIPTTTGTSLTTTVASRQRNFVAFAGCMTAHGVPTKAGARGGLVIGAGANSSIFQAAQKRCRALLPAGQTANPPVTQAQRHTLLVFAACVRAHGVPDDADPSFPPGGGIFGGGMPAGAGETPAAERAAAVCNKLPGPEQRSR